MNTQIEPKSATRGNWGMIDARFISGSVKSGKGWRSKAHRHPGECRGLSASTVARKVETAARIQKLKEAAKRYANA